MGSSSRPCRTVGGTPERREGCTDCRLEPQRPLAASSSVQFSSLRPNSPRLVSVRFDSPRFGSFRLSLSPVASRYWRHGPPARRSVPADILPVILVGAVVVVVVVNFSMCRLGISELAQCKPTPRRRGKIYGTTGPFSLSPSNTTSPC